MATIKLTEDQLKQVKENMAVGHEERRSDWPSYFHPNVVNGMVTLYHGLSCESMDYVLANEELTPHYHPDGGTGIWFSTKCGNDYPSGYRCLISIEVPMDEITNYVGRGKFRIMNEVHLLANESIPINSYNFRIIKLGGIELDDEMLEHWRRLLDEKPEMFTKFLSDTMEYSSLYYYVLDLLNSSSIKNDLDYITEIAETRLGHEYKTNVKEGLIRTYPSQVAKKYVKELFHLDDSCFSIDNPGREGSNDTISVSFTYTKANMTSMDKAFNLCGYKHVKYRNGRKAGEIEVLYSPKFNGDVTNIIRDNRYLIHISPTQLKKNILDKGLVPKMKNSEFAHDGRVYFFPPDISDDGFYLQLRYFSRKNSCKYWTIYTIDTEKLSEDVMFYADPHYIIGIYTTNNIPPSAIILTEDIQIELVTRINKN